MKKLITTTLAVTVAVGLFAGTSEAGDWVPKACESLQRQMDNFRKGKELLITEYPESIQRQIKENNCIVNGIRHKFNTIPQVATSTDELSPENRRKFEENKKIQDQKDAEKANKHEQCKALAKEYRDKRKLIKAPDFNTKMNLIRQFDKKWNKRAQEISPKCRNLMTYY